MADEGGNVASALACDPRESEGIQDVFSAVSDVEVAKLVTSPDVVRDVDLPGHINNLSREQRRSLFLLWRRVLGPLNENAPEPSRSRRGWPFRRKSLSLASLESLEENRVVDERATASDAKLVSIDVGRRSFYGSKLWSGAKDELWLGVLVNFTDPDSCLLRFLRARGWNIEHAFSMFKSMFRWRVEVGVTEMMRMGERVIPIQLLSVGKTFFHGKDRSGHSIIYILARKHRKHDQTIRETERFTVYHMEIARRMLGLGMETITLIIDMSEAGYASMDMASVKYMVSCFQARYPESLNRCYVVNAPWLFWAFWKVITPWLDPVVVSKIKFIKLEELEEYVDSSILKEAIANEDWFQYIHPTSEKQLSGVDLEDIKSQFDLKRDEFLEETRRLCSLSEAGVDLDETRRSQLKAELLSLAFRLNMALFPETHYDRLGVTDDKHIGHVDWSKFRRL